jgi:hypothetical protein
MHLETLPLEVLRMVVNNLTTPEYGHLRLICKTLEKLVFDDFAKEFFTTRQYSLTRFSLQNLLDISRDAAIRPYLSRLILSTDRVEYWHGNDPPEKLDRLLEFSADQGHFQATGADHTMLVEAMRQLPNCRTLEIRDYYSNFKGGRVRDQVNWKSYGSTTFQEHTGRKLCFNASYNNG